MGIAGKLIMKVNVQSRQLLICGVIDDKRTIRMCVFKTVRITEYGRTFFKSGYEYNRLALQIKASKKKLKKEKKTLK